MNTVRNKIEERLNELEDIMIDNGHLVEKEYAVELLKSITKFWSVLGEDERDFCHGVAYAIENGTKWS